MKHLLSNPSGGSGGAQHRSEEGSISVLVIGFISIVVMLAAVLAAVTSIHVERHRLYALADASSQAAADTYAASSAIGSGADPALLGSRAQQAAAQMLARSEHPATLTHVSTGSDQVLVRVSGRAHPPLIGFFIPEGINVEVESAAVIRRR